KPTLMVGSGMVSGLLVSRWRRGTGGAVLPRPRGRSGQNEANREISPFQIECRDEVVERWETTSDDLFQAALFDFSA
ncbi:MAG TPA: hypothetical protein DCR97_14765, partial [Deltaproteobacteria bacterium]|nr:hypothetical protein [Deltaproteobacteria bacterium]